MNELIHPNWHVIALHYPLALLSVGILIELFSFLWRNSTVRTAGRWMILLGALLSSVSLSTGIYAFADAAKGSTGLTGEPTWAQVKQASPWGAEQWQFMKLHLLIMCSAAGLVLATVVGWIACSDHWRQRLHWAFLALLVIAMGGMAAGAWFGGEDVYRYALAVSPQTTPNAVLGGGTEAATGAPSTQPGTAGLAASLKNLSFDPAQLHLLLVGFTAALAAIAIALTIRRWTAGPRLIVEEPAGGADTYPIEPKEGMLETRENLPGTYGEEPVAPPRGPLAPAPAVPAETPPVFAARWWMLSALLALITALIGLWLYEDGNWRIPMTQGLVQKAFHERSGLDQSEWRHLIHLIMAICIFLLPLILALITRFSKRLVWITIIGLVLLAGALGVQVWKGVEMLYSL